MKTLFEVKTLTEFTDYFCDEATCVKHFTATRFASGEYCPHCGHTEIYTFKDGKRYRCAKCKQDFTIKTGTVFGESVFHSQKPKELSANRKVYPLQRERRRCCNDPTFRIL